MVQPNKGGVIGWGVENGVTAYSPVTGRISSRKGSEGGEGSPGGGSNNEQMQRGEACLSPALHS